MTQPIFETILPIPKNAMCFKYCANTIYNALHLDELKKKDWFPKDASLFKDSDPENHVMVVVIESELPVSFSSENRKEITAHFHKQLDEVGFPVASIEPNVSESRHEMFNIGINCLSATTILGLSFLFPPSGVLTLVLSGLSILTTTYTARDHIFKSMHSIRHKQFSNMDSSISLGWFLSCAHTVYHAIVMPKAGSVSMIFMSYLMPIALIALINGMDALKSLINNKSQLELSSSFPQMKKTYLYYPLSQQQQEQLLNFENNLGPQPGFISEPIEFQVRSKYSIKKGMLLKIGPGESFPVDGFILQGHTFIDNSITNGELHQSKKPPQSVPAGAINLGDPVLIYTQSDSFHGKLNKLLFNVNGGEEGPTQPTQNKFQRLYPVLILVSLIAAIGTPLALGILTLPLMIQNLTGILFSICPCTIAIAHELPLLLSIYILARKGILLRKDKCNQDTDEFHTLVFDKTGTLTTGRAEVALHEGISKSLWQRIYLLEKKCGGSHPIAQAILSFYQDQAFLPPLITNIQDESRESSGLSALVQGKTIHIGNLDYVQKKLGQIIQPILSNKAQKAMHSGYTPIYVAEDGLLQGIILIKHEIRKELIDSLKHFKAEKKNLYLLTGDTTLSATAFNEQLSYEAFGQSNELMFQPDHILADLGPKGKDQFLKELMQSKNYDPKGLVLVIDGLNDVLCARTLEKKGGVSCSITPADRAAHFTTLSLNGSLDYLSQHNTLNCFMKKIIAQNQGIIAFGTLAFVAILITFSTAGLAVLPLIPLSIMVMTTLFTLFNTYRVKLNTDIVMDKQASPLQHYLASDFSVGLLMGGSLFLVVSLISSALATLTITTIPNFCLMTATGLFGLFFVLGGACMIALHCRGCYKATPDKIQISFEHPIQSMQSLQPQKNLPAVLESKVYQANRDCLGADNASVKSVKSVNSPSTP